MKDFELEANLVDGPEIEITNHCNLKCLTCERLKRDRFGFMSLKDFRKTIDLVKDWKSREIIFSGHGDIFLHKNIFRMFAYALKVLPGVNLVIPTKGQSIDPAALKKIKKFQEAGHNITPSFSIFSLSEKKDELLTGGNLKHLLYLLETARKLGVYFTVEFLLMAQNIDEYPDFLNFAAAYGLKNYGFGLVNNWSGAMEDGKFKKFYSQELDRFIRPRPRGDKCDVFKVPGCVFIDYEGNIKLCSLQIGEPTLLGHIAKDSLADIVKRKKSLDREEACGRCPMHKHIIYWTVDN